MVFLMITISGLFLTICIFNMLYIKYGKLVISEVYKSNVNKSEHMDIMKLFIKRIILRSLVTFISMIVAIVGIKMSSDILTNKLSLIVLSLAIIVLNICAFNYLKEFWEVMKIADKFIETASKRLYRRSRFYGNGATGKY